MITFFKYNSCGNDFIIIDNRDKVFSISKNYIRKLCDRKFGIGADGLILLEKNESANYFMNYFNSDGVMSSFCGNGNLCCGHLAYHLGILNKKNKGVFSTREGVFDFQVEADNVSISMPNVLDYMICKKDFQDFTINTGSPHYISFRDSVDKIDVNKEGRIIRNSPSYVNEGVNVTFVASSLFLPVNQINLPDASVISIRTYERGVESETLSCGTGVVAAALSEIIYYAGFLDLDKTKNSFHHSTRVNTLGGMLHVNFKCDYRKNNDVINFNFSDIILSNKVNMVFQGHLFI